MAPSVHAMACYSFSPVGLLKTSYGPQGTMWPLAENCWATVPETIEAFGDFK